MRTITAAGVLLAFGSAALAAEFHPADYSPVEGVAIRTLRLEPAGGPTGRVVVVGISNETAEALNASYDCTLLDDKGSAFDTTSGSADAVPPQQEVISKTRSFEANPAKVVCRIEFTVPAKG